MDWHQLKEWVERGSGLNMDALHVYGGVFVQLAVALVLRRSLRSAWPLLVVLAAIISNEAYDLHYEIWPNRGDQWVESIKDGWNTMLMPTILFLLARFAPGLMTGSRRR